MPRAYGARTPRDLAAARFDLAGGAVVAVVLGVGHVHLDADVQILAVLTVGFAYEWKKGALEWD